MRLRSYLFGICACYVTGLFAHAQNIQSLDRPLPDMRVVEGYRVELVVAEPQIMDPVAIAWGFDGKLWVVEMADYPLGMDDSGKPGGRIRFLQDTTGDGHYDRSQIFLDGCTYPNGVTPWRKGVLITSAPDIIYAEDTTGDGKADLKKVMYTGFKEGNQQLRVNGLRFGLDGWFYGANGLSHGEVHAVGATNTVDLTHKDFRIHPDSMRIEAIEGPTQFGRHRDDWGNWFGCDNSRLAYHFAIPDRYQKRNPHIPYHDARKQMTMERNPPVYPYSKLQKRIHADYMGNRFTSICGTMVYRDTILFDEPTLLACEPVHNCITRRRIVPKGASYEFERVDSEREREFMGSTNHLFRPVQLQTGPDGALYVVDMHRAIVEHPHWVPKEIRETWQKEADLREGHEQGRIYRIVRDGDLPVGAGRDGGTRSEPGGIGAVPPKSVGSSPRKPPAGEPKHLPVYGLRDIPNLKEASPETLNSLLLQHENGWVRDAIHQRMLEQPELCREDLLIKTIKAERPQNPGMVHALHLLHVRGHLSPELLREQVANPHPMIRRQVMRLAESVDPKLFISWVGEKDPHVRLQTALSLSMIPMDLPVGMAISRSIRAGELDAYHLHALACGMAMHQVYTPEMPPPLVAYLFQTLAGEKEFERLKTLPAVFLQPDKSGAYSVGQWQNAALYLKLMKGRITLEPFEKMQTRALSVFPDPSAQPEIRAATINFLRAWPMRSAVTETQLIALLDSQAESSIKEAVITVLESNAKPETAKRLIASWRRYEPSLRSSLIDKFLRKSPWTMILLDALENNVILKNEVSAAQRRRLTRSGNAEIKKRSEVIFGALNSQRAPVVEAYQDVLALKGDAQKGPAVFKKVCIACHRLDEVGQDIGPNLRSLSDRSPKGLLIAIIDPNQNVEPRYLMYECKLTNGESRYGLLSNQSDQGVELQGADGQKELLARKDIAELVPMESSFMPIGLEATMSKQELADLIAYLGYPE